MSATATCPPDSVIPDTQPAALPGSPTSGGVSAAGMKLSVLVEKGVPGHGYSTISFAAFTQTLTWYQSLNAALTESVTAGLPAGARFTPSGIATWNAHGIRGAGVMRLMGES